MAQSTNFEDRLIHHAPSQSQVEALHPIWNRIKLVMVRSVFWAYERGSWQYDVICAVIIAFILLTPRAWFRDRPTLELTALRHDQGVVEIGHVKEGWSYLVDARLVESLSPQDPEDAVQEILRRRVQKPFTVTSIEPIRDKNNVLLGYRAILLKDNETHPGPSH